MAPIGQATAQDVGTAYCTCGPSSAPACAGADTSAGCVNSTGVGAKLEGTGSASVLLDNLQLVVSNVSPFTTGQILMGTVQAQAPFGDGLLCVASARRFPSKQADAAGVLTEGPGIVAHTLGAFPPTWHITAGSTFHFQALYRDIGGPCGTNFNLTNGLSVMFGIHGEMTLPMAGGEPFTDRLNEDPLASGASWGGGTLSAGIGGGGAGRLGPLYISAGQEVVLNTDSQLFPLAGQVRSLLDNSRPGIDYDPLNPSTYPKITVTGGAFEFSSITIEPNGRLVLVGSSPGRVFARGQVVHEGVIDLSGETPTPHASNSGGMQFANQLDPMATRFGGLGGAGGVAAGGGGQGADRMDTAGVPAPLSTTAGGIVFPEGEIAVYDGRAGGGVGGDAATAGEGGLHYPPTLPGNWDLGNPAFGDAEISILPVDIANTPHTCGVAMVAGPGGGGAYALSGGPGLPDSPYTSINPGLLPNVPGDTPGGSNASLNLEAPGTEIGFVLIRHLDFFLGHLRGGSGGGGGGTSVYGSKNNNNFESTSGCMVANAHLFPFFDHSAAGGGGGGGALQLVAGRQLSVSGSINCSGGDGGSALEANASLVTNCTESGANSSIAPDGGTMAAPGGGGSGGALRLQSQIVRLGGQYGFVDVSGGVGGVGAGGSVGGFGSPGLVRIERADYQDAATDAAIYAPFIEPYDPNNPILNTPYTSAAFLSLGAWEEQRFRPETYSGSQSCWMQPGIDFFALGFSLDDPSLPDDPDAKGWNMDVRYQTPNGVKLFPYRGLSTDPDYPSMGGLDFEAFLGSTLNHDELNPDAGSILAVRFQAARSAGDLSDRCEVDLSNGGDIVAGSLTPWVRSPQELNMFSSQPNMVRFSVVFEPRLAVQGAIQSRVLGVTNLKVKVTPN